MAHATARRIDHVAVVVKDADEAVTRFAADLGLVVSADVRSPDGGVRLVYLEAGDTTLQLVQPLRPGPVAVWLRDCGEGLHHICFDVPDLAGALASLPDEDPAAITMGGRGCPVAFIDARPHGVVIELTETVPSVALRGAAT